MTNFACFLSYAESRFLIKVIKLEGLTFEKKGDSHSGGEETRKGKERLIQ
jgi:hypothetical protein